MGICQILKKTYIVKKGVKFFVVNVKKAVEKDIQNICIKSIVVLKKNKEMFETAIILGKYKEQPNILLVAKISFSKNEQKWKLEIVYNFDNFQSAIEKFADWKRNVCNKPIKKSEVHSSNLAVS